MILCFFGRLIYTERIDHLAFGILNSSLVGHSFAQRLFAFANTRLFDSLAGIILAAYFLIPGLAFSRGRRRYATIGFISLALLFQPWRLLIGALSGANPSPGRVFAADMFRLDTINSAAKIASDHSFPGDHTAVLIAWAFYIVLVGDSKVRFSAIGYAAILSLPRLVGGGHWLSDILFGSPLVAFPPLLLLLYGNLPDRILVVAIKFLPKVLLPSAKLPSSVP